MTIRKGRDWGGPGLLSPTAPVASSDPAAFELLNAGDALPEEIGLVGGDFHRSLGAPGGGVDRLRQGPAMRFPVDLGSVGFDGAAPLWFLSHLLVQTRRRGGLWHGPTWIVMNGSFLGGANLGPRAHPNDGRLDMTTGSLEWRQRRRARRRALTGAHLPHPSLHQRRIAETVIEDPAGLWVRIDGSAARQVQRIELRCVSDAITVVV